MKKLILIMLALFPLTLFAQKWNFGADAGVSINRFSVNAGDISSSYLVKSGECYLGFNGGGNVSYTSKKGFVYGTGLYYKSNKSGSFYILNNPDYTFVTYGGIDYVKFKYGSIELPINFGYKFRLSEKFSITPLVGIWGALNVGGDVMLKVKNEKNQVPKTYYSNNPFKEITYNFNEREYTFNPFSRVDFGLMVGVELSLSKFFFKFGANFGLINARNDLDSSFKNNSYAFTLGYKF